MTATLQTSTSSASEVASDVIAVAITPGENGPVLTAEAAVVDAALDGGLSRALSALGATGAAEEVTRVAAAGQTAAPVIAAVGIGAIPGPGPDPEVLRRCAGTAVRSLASRKVRSIAVAFPAPDPLSVQAIGLGAVLGGYAFTRYRDQPPAPAITVLVAKDLAAGEVTEALTRARALGAAVSLVRDLVNTSPSDLYPEVFAAQAATIAAGTGLGIEVLDEDALAAQGYGGIVAVGRGSARPPRLVRITYTHRAAARTVVFVGKGITFDSGGLSLKPPKSMETMKGDMAGAASVLAAIMAIASIGLPLNVVGYLPLAENMPGAGAQRPSDVITIYGGTTVEVLNTDAEGRLVLADALARSGQDEPDLVVDVATLTGAQAVALGKRTGAVMASDDTIREQVVAAATRAGEALWPMPLPEDLRKGLDSKVADLANVAGDRDGGMLTAGLFLREFVPDGTRWAHLDIAGPAFNSGEAHGYTPRGGTGFAVRTLVQIGQDVADGRM